MNVDKNIYNWVYSLLKYGDVYLRLYRESDYTDPVFKKDRINQSYTARTTLHEGIEEQKEKIEEAIKLSMHEADDPYSYYLEMVADPGTMFELVKYGKTYGYVEVPNADTTMGADASQTWAGITPGTNSFNFKLKSSDVNIYQADDFVHACLEDNISRFPEKVDLFIETDEDGKLKTDSAKYSYQVRRGKSLLFDKYKV